MSAACRIASLGRTGAASALTVASLGRLGGLVGLADFIAIIALSVREFVEQLIGTLDSP